MADQQLLEQVDRIPGEVAAEADEDTRVANLQREYQQLAALPADDLHDAMCRMVRAEFALDDEALNRFVRTRLLTWGRLDDERATIITEAYRHAIESVEAKIALDNAAVVQSVVVDLPPRTQERLRGIAPVMFDDQATPQLSEGASAQYGTAHHATIDTPVFSSDGEELGRVSAVESKYFEVEPDDGDRFWLGIECVADADSEGVSLRFTAAERDRFALEPGEQGPVQDDTGKTLVTDREDEARRQYLIRGRDEREPADREQGPLDSPLDAEDDVRNFGWTKPA